MDLELQFEHRGSPGVIYATVGPNDDPTRWGYRQQDFGPDLWSATGFPVCRARVKHPAEGYGRLMGWVQVIWSGPPTLLTGEFDPWAAFNGLDLPYCWYGFTPELFDTPWRSDRTVDLNWEAHSWLCAAPGSIVSREVAMLAGFSWGYQLRDQKVAIVGPSVLEDAAWDDDMAILRACFPTWSFIPRRTTG